MERRAPAKWNDLNSFKRICSRVIHQEKQQRGFQRVQQATWACCRPGGKNIAYR